MAIDKTNSLVDAEHKTKAARTFIEIKRDAKKIRDNVKNNLEKDKKKVTTTVNKLKDQKKRYQRQVKTQMDEMLSLVQFNSGSGSSTFRYIKEKFIQASVRISPKIFNLLLESTISSLGCSHQQAFDPNQIFYIKVKSVDLQRLLKRDPSEEIAAVAYEKTPPTPNSIPYSMNREMWDRLQHLNVPVDYYGASGQKLFEITYVQSNGSVTGDFFRIKLYGKINGVNKVADFLIDYYKSIKIVDTNNLFQQLMDQITGAVSYEAGLGTGEIDMKNKFLLILQRILGLCFDNKKEIDVSGNSKVAELDGIDESFFELTDIDLRYLDQMSSNIKRGVVEFEECGEVLLPVDSKSIIDGLLKFNNAKNIKDEESIAQGLLDSLTDNEKWKLLVPNSANIKLSVDLSFLTNLPKAIMMALLSPKVLLPLLIMTKSIGQTISDAVESLGDFIKLFKKYVIKIMSNIGALFVKELFEIIKKDIRQLVSEIISDIKKESLKKKYKIILLLVQLALTIYKLVTDWKQCKSVVDEILALFNIASGFITNKIPSFLLAGSEFLPGFSDTRAFINVIEEFQKMGLPTGPMPDGSPNLVLQSIFSQIMGTESENTNRKTQVFIKPLTITPAGITLPSGNMFGMSY
jgi:hypothetical protein